MFILIVDYIFDESILYNITFHRNIDKVNLDLIKTIWSICDLNKLSEFSESKIKIHVGENYGSVTLKGAISNEGLFVWQPNKRLKKYIRLWFGGM